MEAILLQWTWILECTLLISSLPPHTNTPPTLHIALNLLVELNHIYIYIFGYNWSTIDFSHLAPIPIPGTWEERKLTVVSLREVASLGQDFGTKIMRSTLLVASIEVPYAQCTGCPVDQRIKRHAPNPPNFAVSVTVLFFATTVKLVMIFSF